VVGLDSIMASFNKMGAMMGDMKNEIVKALGDDDYVMCWAKETSTAKMDMPEMGMKKGQASTYNAIEVSKFNKDGKVVEHWSFMDMNEMMKMMGSMGGHDMNNMKDSTGK
jgi:predicted SnoaL-like aldol condensation-catalyzing enzyme